GAAAWAFGLSMGGGATAGDAVLAATCSGGGAAGTATGALTGVGAVAAGVIGFCTATDCGERGCSTYQPTVAASIPTTAQADQRPQGRFSTDAGTRSRSRM